MKVVVTGGMGFIGSHIVDRYVSLGHEVVVIDNGSSKQHNTNARATYVCASIQSGSMPSIDGADLIIHAAAHANLRQNWDPKEGRANRIASFRDNVEATRNLLEAMPHVPLVYLSTACVYGPCYSSAGFAPEDFEVANVQSVYAANKIACEAMVAAYAKGRRFRQVTLRLVNVVGARTHQGVIADFVRMMRTDGTIHAADNGQQRKQWVCVEDVVDMVVTAGNPEFPGGTYNVSNIESSVSWWDIVDAMGVDRSSVTFEDRIAGAIGDPVDIKVQTAGRHSRDVAGGIERALGSLGWRK